MSYFRLSIFALSLVLSVGASAANTVHEYTLRNGLKVFVKEDHRAPVVVFQVWYKVGSANEYGGITGISHVLEHMMFKGTKRYPVGKFSKIIAANGGSENAGTSDDFTFYFEKLKSDRLALGMRLEADRMMSLTLPAKEFDKEIEVVKEERRMRVDDNPPSFTYERFRAAAHLSRPYHHMTIGWMNDLNNMTVEDVRDWYKKYYAPNNAILVVVGDVEPDKVYKLAKRYFARQRRIKLAKTKPQVEPKALGMRQVTVQRAAKLPVLYVGFNTPSLLTAKEKWHAYALEMIGNILDRGNSSRLQKDLVTKRQIATEVSASYDIYSKYDSLLTLNAIPTKEHTVAELKTALLEHIKKLQTESVTKEELERIKAQIIADKIYNRDSVFGQAIMIGILESVGLSWREFDNTIKQIQAITPEQIQKAAKLYLRSDRMTIAELQPQPLNKQ